VGGFYSFNIVNNGKNLFEMQKTIDMQYRDHIGNNHKEKNWNEFARWIIDKLIGFLLNKQYIC